ncbi:receptor activity-modifying protein 1 isoform X1 [Fundulus heteroclitus]|uniref:receptor activity-modifying protein 1 isoform X1 n=1 Tax=Fundulus heteroclitus TaxID=8078 RepID=UPI00165A4362|nr:receptor activity-modifying protein 1 isoform X1 [Fundulus heteroclitus]
MISYFLFLAIFLCVVVSQPANITDEFNKVSKNQTFSVFTYGNGAINPKNGTTTLYKDELKDLDELEKNNTFSVISEDNENFQDQENEFPNKDCHRDDLIKFSHVLCGDPFHAEMHNISTDDWCVLKSIIRPYNDLTRCLEIVTNYVGCYFPNSDNQDFFLYIHSSYFQNCTEKAEDMLEDAPTSLVVALTIIPVSLIPVLVCLVLWKS